VIEHDIFSGPVKGQVELVRDLIIEAVGGHRNVSGSWVYHKDGRARVLTVERRAKAKFVLVMQENYKKGASYDHERRGDA